MEGINLNKHEVKFSIENSPIKEAYKLLEADTPLDLFSLYTEEDQKLMHSNSWDYDNENLITNKIKNILEKVDFSQLTAEEKKCCSEILWFWYHHAISFAVFQMKDKAKAIICAQKALDLQAKDNPNQITRLLYLLVNDKVNEAEEWAKEIKDEVEKQTAKQLIEQYKKGYFF